MPFFFTISGERTVRRQHGEKQAYVEKHCKLTPKTQTRLLRRSTKQGNEIWPNSIRPPIDPRVAGRKRQLNLGLSRR